MAKTDGMNDWIKSMINVAGAEQHDWDFSQENQVRAALGFDSTTGDTLQRFINDGEDTKNYGLGSAAATGRFGNATSSIQDMAFNATGYVMGDTSLENMQKLNEASDLLREFSNAGGVYDKQYKGSDEIKLAEANGNKYEAYVDVAQKFFRDKGYATGSGLSQENMDLLSGSDAGESIKKQLASIQTMGDSFVRSALQQANSDSYAEKQQIIEAQRKYGITGAVANAQMQDFQLRNRDKMMQIQSQAQMQFASQYGPMMQTLQQQQDQNVAMQIQGITKRNENGEFKSAQDLFEQLQTVPSLRGKVTQEMAQNLYDNPIKGGDVIRGISGDGGKVDTTKDGA